MKLRTILIGMLLSMMATPAFPCGPMNSGTGMNNNSGGGTTNVSPGRKKWIKKRIKELRPRIDDYRSAERTSRGLDRIQGAVNDRPGQVFFPQGQSSEDRWRYMKNRFEFLALKAEVGRASPKEIAEMHALQHALLPRR